MSLLQMSFSGAVLVLVIAAIRAVTINRLPKKTFLILWGIVLLRLLVPYTLPSAFSLYTLIEIKTPVMFSADKMENQSVQVTENSVVIPAKETGYGQIGELSLLPEKSIPPTKSITHEILITPAMKWQIVWLAGVILCAGFFVISYLHWRFAFQTALPVQNHFVGQWLKMHLCRRPVCVKLSEQISTPLTYGIVKPVILMPKETDWENTQQLEYVLLHEYVHICHYDSAVKLVSTLALCVHWFNPFVWVMYGLLQRDIELACDESVVRRFGESAKSTYANMLIDMEAQRSGFVPLGNGFSKNPIEERIVAIMRTKKTSVIAIVMSVILIAGVAAAFATNASAKKVEEAENNTVNFSVFSEEEIGKLLALRFDGYEDMSVSEYQQKVWELTDTVSYRALLERFSQDTELYENKDSDEVANFLFYTLLPLTAEKWQISEFGGYCSTDYSEASDNAALEYFVTLDIQNADTLTVGEYNNARAGMMSALQEVLQGKSVEQLQSEIAMQKILHEEMMDLEGEWSNENLKASVEFVYMPLSEYIAQNDNTQSNNAQRNNGRNNNGQNNNARNEETQDNTVQKASTQNIVTKNNNIQNNNVQNNNTQSNSTQNNNMRNNNSQNSDVQNMAQEQEPREYPNGTQEDYRSLLALKIPDYQKMSVADFNMKLLDWANENYERMERIGIDTSCHDFAVDLTDEELSFVTVSVQFSSMENGAYVRSNYTRKPEVAPSYGQYLPEKAKEQNGHRAWCNLYYQFSYHMKDKKAITVEERDDCVSGVMEGVAEFWNNTPLETLLSMTEEDVAVELERIAEAFNNDKITVEILKEQVSFECMNEFDIDEEQYQTGVINIADFLELMDESSTRANMNILSNIDALKVREEASQNAAVVTILQEDREVIILSEKNGFYHILISDTENNLEGWVKKEYVKVD